MIEVKSGRESGLPGGRDQSLLKNDIVQGKIAPKIASGY